MSRSLWRGFDPPTTRPLPRSRNRLKKKAVHYLFSVRNMFFYNVSRRTATTGSYAPYAGILRAHENKMGPQSERLMAVRLGPCPARPLKSEGGA